MPASWKDWYFFNIDNLESRRMRIQSSIVTAYSPKTAKNAQLKNEMNRRDRKMSARSLSGMLRGKGARGSVGGQEEEGEHEGEVQEEQVEVHEGDEQGAAGSVGGHEAEEQESEGPARVMEWKEAKADGRNRKSKSGQKSVEKKRAKRVFKTMLMSLRRRRRLTNRNSKWEWPEMRKHEIKRCLNQCLGIPLLKY